MTRQDLGSRLRDFEDRFVERKPEGAGGHEFKRVMVSFANSVPEGRTAVLYVGVANDGAIQGCGSPESLQKTLARLAENDCYPPIWVQTEVLPTSPKPVVAVEIPYSPKKPYFAGLPVIRRGPECVVATDEEVQALLLHRNSTAHALLADADKTWTVEAHGKGFGSYARVGENFADAADCKIVRVTPHFVSFQRIADSRTFSELLLHVHISYDDFNHRPRAIIHGW